MKLQRSLGGGPHISELSKISNFCSLFRLVHRRGETARLGAADYHHPQVQHVPGPRGAGSRPRRRRLRRAKAHQYQ